MEMLSLIMSLVAIYWTVSFWPISSF